MTPEILTKPPRRSELLNVEVEALERSGLRLFFDGKIWEKVVLVCLLCLLCVFFLCFVFLHVQVGFFVCFWVLRLRVFVFWKYRDLDQDVRVLVRLDWRASELVQEAEIPTCLFLFFS